MATVFELLDLEWVRLSHDRPAARHLAEVCRAAGRARSLDDVERFVRRARDADADAVLLALVRRAVDRDALAARVLLQLLMPGTRRLARKWWALGDSEECAAAAVAAVYHRIRRYPLERRPGRVAANILMDAEHELRRAVRGPVVAPIPDPLDHWHHHDDHRPVPHPAEELAELLVDAVDDGVIQRDDAELIARSRIAGDRVADVAEHRGLRPRTLWDRRQRAEKALVSARRAPAGEAPFRPHPPKPPSRLMAS
jgi:hypothetical protein